MKLRVSNVLITGGSSGIGLAIAKQIVALHGGDIAVNSKPGKGPEFLLLLPAN